MSEAFLSYNRDDAKFANELWSALHDEKIDAWLDTNVLPPGASWREEQAQAIADTPCFITIFGPHGVGDEQKYEINYALELKKSNEKLRLIYVLAPGCEEKKLGTLAQYIKSNYSYFDLKEGLNDENVPALASIIKGRFEADYQHQGQSQNSTRRRVVAISGGSGSGTGKICEIIKNTLASSLGPQSCTTVSMSSYYIGDSQTRDVEFTNSYGAANFDTLDVIDFERLIGDIDRLHHGMPIQSAVYNKQKHVPDLFKSVSPPAHLVLVEGVYLLHDRRIRELSDATVYVDVEADIRLARRAWKDVTIYKMGLGEVFSYYFRAVKPAFEEWVEPFTKDAKLKLPVVARDHLSIGVNDAAKKMIRFFESDGLIPRTAM